VRRRAHDLRRRSRSAEDVPGEAVGTLERSTFNVVKRGRGEKGQRGGWRSPFPLFSSACSGGWVATFKR
jgi:hypothetical protein